MDPISRLFCRASLSAAVITLAVVGPVRAGNYKPSNGWTFQISPYMWATGVKGSVGIFKDVPPANIDISFSDVFNHIDWPAAVFVAAEARSPDRLWGIFNDLEYLKLDASAPTPGPFFGSGQLTQKNFTDTLEAAYRVVDAPSVELDGLAGARFYWIDNQFTLTPGLLKGRSADVADSWADLVIGARAIVPIGDSGFFLNAYSDVGGFGLSGNWTWQAYGGGGYNFNNWLTGYAAYRYLDVHHQDGGFIYDVVQQGPLLGVGIKF